MELRTLIDGRKAFYLYAINKAGRSHKNGLARVYYSEEKDVYYATQDRWIGIIIFDAESEEDAMDIFYNKYLDCGGDIMFNNEFNKSNKYVSKKYIKDNYYFSTVNSPDIKLENYWISSDGVIASIETWITSIEEDLSARLAKEITDKINQNILNKIKVSWP